jgi:WXXGXW repeat (2 copies)
MRLGALFRLCPPALAVTLLLAGCVGVTREVAGPPYPAPPPIPTEAVPKPPVSEAPLIWQPGHWDWTGSAYAWQGGRWVLREGHGTQWQDGYWSNSAGAWQWVPAHWL